MAILRLYLPNSLHEAVRKLAERESVSINQLATLAIPEKVAALSTADYLIQRASRADKKSFLKAMGKVADVAPEKKDT